MPLYDYQCQKCREVTEVRHGFREAYADPCAHCGGPMGRVFNPAGIVFKGSGFYITDSRKPSAAEGAAPAAEAKKPETKKPDVSAA